MNPIDEWEIDPREVVLGAEIGQGAFGRVLTGYYRDTRVAIKITKGNESLSSTLFCNILLITAKVSSENNLRDDEHN